VIEASQMVLQDAIDASDTIGCWGWDIPNDRLYADVLVAVLFNVELVAAADGASGSTFFAALHPEDRDRTHRLITNSAAAGRSYVAEYRVRSADGQTRGVLARSRCFLDYAGCPLRGCGLLIEITQNKHDETAYVAETFGPPDHLLERVAEHLLSIH
jgi:PAS domain-containing protein